MDLEARSSGIRRDCKWRVLRYACLRRLAGDRRCFTSKGES